MSNEDRKHGPGQQWFRVNVVWALTGWHHVMGGRTMFALLTSFGGDGDDASTLEAIGDTFCDAVGLTPGQFLVTPCNFLEADDDPLDHDQQRINAKIRAHTANTAKQLGLPEPKTMGDLLQMLVHAGVLTEADGKYEVVFPPPLPEERLKLSSLMRQRLQRLRAQYSSGSGAASVARACIESMGPDFVAPPWLQKVVEQRA